MAERTVSAHGLFRGCTERSPRTSANASFMCEGSAGHGGMHSALNGRVQWDEAMVKESVDVPTGPPDPENIWSDLGDMCPLDDSIEYGECPVCGATDFS